MNNSCIQQVIIHRTTVDPFDFQVKKEEVRGAFQLLDDSLLKRLLPEGQANTTKHSPNRPRTLLPRQSCITHLGLLHFLLQTSDVIRALSSLIHGENQKRRRRRWATYSENKARASNTRERNPNKDATARAFCGSSRVGLPSWVLRSNL